MENLENYILEQVANGHLDCKLADDILEKMELSHESKPECAIIGMACRLPDAEDYRAFHKNLDEKKRFN